MGEMAGKNHGNLLVGPKLTGRGTILMQRISHTR